jgi:hypothetical protein
MLSKRKISFFLFFVVLEFEFRASHFLGKCFTTWALTPSFFALVNFLIGSHFCVGVTLDHTLLSMSPSWLWLQMYATTQSLLFLSRLGLNHTPSSSSFWVAGLTDMHHHSWLSFFTFCGTRDWTQGPCKCSVIWATPPVLLLLVFQIETCTNSASAGLRLQSFYLCLLYVPQCPASNSS